MNKYKEFAPSFDEWVKLNIREEDKSFKIQLKYNRPLVIHKFDPKKGKRMTVIIDHAHITHLQNISKEWNIALQELIHIILGEFIEDNLK